MESPKHPLNRKFAVVSQAEASSVPYPYVYVNDDGSVRELHPSERLYLETLFNPFDGSVPYIKDSYNQKNGWGSLRGYCHRSKIPSDIEILNAPLEDPRKVSKDGFIEKLIDSAAKNGFTVTDNKNGTLTLKRTNRIESDN